MHCDTRRGEFSMTSRVTSVKHSKDFGALRKCPNYNWERNEPAPSGKKKKKKIWAKVTSTLMELCICSLSVLQFAALLSYWERFALSFRSFQVWFSFLFPHVRWRCQISLKMVIKATFSPPNQILLSFSLKRPAYPTVSSDWHGF